MVDEIFGAVLLYSIDTYNKSALLKLEDYYFKNTLYNLESLLSLKTFMKRNNLPYHDPYNSYTLMSTLDDGSLNIRYGKSGIIIMTKYSDFSVRIKINDGKLYYKQNNESESVQITDENKYEITNTILYSFYDYYMKRAEDTIANFKINTKKRAS